MTLAPGVSPVLLTAYRTELIQFLAKALGCHAYANLLSLSEELESKN